MNNVRTIPYRITVNEDHLYGIVSHRSDDTTYKYQAAINYIPTNTLLTVGVFETEDSAKQWVEESMKLMLYTNNLEPETADDYEKDRMQ
jgi:hypothetical protein